MKTTCVALGLALAAAGSAALAQEFKAPQPTVPQRFTLMGQYVVIAYNNTGYASLGYRVTQESVGQDWMLLDVGFTMRDGAKDFTLKREDLKVKTPDGTVIP